jgi:hypothetical protein
MKAYIINTDGTGGVVEFDHAGASYSIMQNAVGGYFECVSLSDDLDMWVNEEGKLLGLPTNEIGTRMWRAAFGPTDIIVGNIIFTGGADDNGDTLGLSDRHVDRLDEVRLAYLTAMAGA